MTSKINESQNDARYCSNPIPNYMALQTDEV